MRSNSTVCHSWARDRRNVCRPNTGLFSERLLVVTNLLDREFSAEKAHQCWVGDLTYLRATEGSVIATGGVLDDLRLLGDSGCTPAARRECRDGQQRRRARIRTGPRHRSGRAVRERRLSKAPRRDRRDRLDAAKGLLGQSHGREFLVAGI